MNIESFRTHCLSKKGVTEGFPFDDKTLVFKVMEKVFAITGVDVFEFINLKCAPEKAIELRERFEGVKPGYHMNKKHWNSIYIDSDISDTLIYEWINDSYQLIVSSLTKKKQKELENL